MFNTVSPLSTTSLGLFCQPNNVLSCFLVKLYYLNQVEWNWGSNGTSSFKIERTYRTRPIWNYEHAYSLILLHFVNSYLSSTLRWETRWLIDLCSGLETRLEKLCCVLGQVTVVSQYLSQPRFNEWVPWNLMLGLGEGVILFWTSIPSKERRMLHKPWYPPAVGSTWSDAVTLLNTLRASVAIVPRRGTNMAVAK